MCDWDEGIVFRGFIALLLLVLGTTIMLHPGNLYGQQDSSLATLPEIAPKEKYLVDSLVLNDLSEEDRMLVDSGLALYSQAKDDTTRLNAIKLIVEQSWDENVWPKYNEWSLNFAREKLKQNPSEKVRIRLLKSLAGCLNNKGLIARNRGNLKEAHDYFLEGLRIQQDNNFKEDIATTLGNIGMVFNDQGDVEKTLEFYFKSLQIEEEVGNKQGIAYSYNNIGYVYYNQNEFKSALEFYEKSRVMLEEIDDQAGLAYVLNNVGSIYKEYGDPTCTGEVDSCKQKSLDRALQYFFESMAKRKNAGDQTGVGNSLHNIGGTYYKQGKMDEALKFDLASLELREKIQDQSGITFSLISVAATMQKMGRIAEARTHAQRALDLAQQIGYPENIMRAANALRTIDLEQYKWRDAYEHYNLYITMRDSINNEKTEKASIRQKTKYEFEKVQVLRDAENDKLLAIEKEEKEKQQIVSIAAVVGTVLILIFLIIIWKRLKITREQKAIIEEVNEELNQTNEEILAQRDQIERQKELVDEQNEELNQINEEILAQRDQIEHQKLIVERKNEDIMASITYAQRIQEAILPSDELMLGNLNDYFVLYKPKDIVSGDFYWVEAVDSKVYWAAVDCTGHGVPGAFMSILGVNGLRKIVNERLISKPSEILKHLTNHVMTSLKETKGGEQVKDGMDIALCCWDRKTNILEFAGAYNPLYLIRDGEIRIVKGTKRPIGAFRRKALPDFENHEIQVRKGDCLYVFTDGYADQFGGDESGKFTYKAFRDVLLSVQDRSMEEQKEVLDQTFLSWKLREEQLDDVCVIGVKI